MSGYEFREGFVFDNSVTEGKIFYTYYPLCGKEAPACYKHGAINCKAIREDGKLWRCSEEGCGHGCFEPIKK